MGDLVCHSSAVFPIHMKRRRQMSKRMKEGISKIISVEEDGLEEMGQELGLNQGVRR